MNMNVTTQGRALLYHRDSGGRAEMAPPQYVEWAQRKARELNLSFDGTAEQILAMMREGRSWEGDLYLDYDVKGSVLCRPGLDALIKRAKDDPSVTHVFIPRRDRLARPDDPTDGMKLEDLFRMAGKTIVYMDRNLPPLRRGKKADIGEQILALVDFNEAEKFSRDLAQKIHYAQLHLARRGYSTGGRPPYGFRRWLVQDDGTRVRELAAGERVRMAGHHVVWLPTAESELRVIRRILTMLETMPASRVAAQLAAEGIPSPDAGRYRKDRGVRHRVSGVWHQTTVVNIALNPLLVAVATFGRRSMGDKLRFSPQGPRELEEKDFREDDKAKVIRNPEETWITAPAGFEPVVDVERHKRLLADLDARGGTQRGKPRSHNPTENPLGGRVFDLNCSWPMYRRPYNGSFRYTCGAYGQSHGALCAHNHVDGPTAARFVLSCIRQRMLLPSTRLRVEERLRELAQREIHRQQPSDELQRKRTELATIDRQMEKAGENMLLAETPEQHRAMREAFDRLQARQAALKNELASLEASHRAVTDVETELRAALATLDRLRDLDAGSAPLEAARQIFQLTNARLFLRFRPEQVKRRRLNRAAGGVVVFGSAPDPIEIYRGPTGRRALKPTGSIAGRADNPRENTVYCPPQEIGSFGPEGSSSGNVSRGDWI